MAGNVECYQKITNEEERLYFKDLLKDILKYTPSKFCGLVGNAISIPIYTSLLSKTQYGTYMLSIAFLSFLCIIFSDWVGLSGLRFFKHHEINKDASKYFTTLISLLLINLSIMFLLTPIYICIPQVQAFFKIPVKLILFVLILIIPVAFRALFFQILRAQIKPLNYTVSTIINQFLSIGISYILMKYFHLGAYSILLGMCISIIFIDFVLLCQIDIKKYFVWTRPKFNILKTLVFYGVPISVTSLSLWIINQSNRFIMHGLHGVDQVGLVGVAYNATFSILMTTFVVITFASIPRIYSLYEQNKDVRPLISKLTYLLALISLPTIVLYSVHAKDVVMFLSNAKFKGAEVLVPYLSFSVFFIVMTDFTTLQYHLSKKTYLDTIIRVISAITGLVLNVIFIKKWGLVGLGIATLIGNIVYFLLSTIVVVPNHGWQVPYKKFAQILISFVPASALYVYLLKDLKLNLVFESLILLVVYYLTYFVIAKLTDKRVSA